MPFKSEFRVGAPRLHLVPALCLHALSATLRLHTSSLRFVEGDRGADGWVIFVLVLVLEAAGTADPAGTAGGWRPIPTAMPHYSPGLSSRGGVAASTSAMPVLCPPFTAGSAPPSPRLRASVPLCLRERKPAAFDEGDKVSDKVRDKVAALACSNCLLPLSPLPAPLCLRASVRDFC